MKKDYNKIEVKSASFAYKKEKKRASRLLRLFKGRKKKKETDKKGDTRKVLDVEQLSIKPGEITFIVGVSGSGKSTLLEALGLMNDTFPKKPAKNMSIFFKNLEKDKFGFTEHDIIKPNIWDQDHKLSAAQKNKIAQLQQEVEKLFSKLKGIPESSENEKILKTLKEKQKEIYELENNFKLRERLRRDNFSFIFQNTNLMPNFSSVENVSITDMLHGHCFEESYLKSLLLFKTLGLGDLDIDISPLNISGGQRQRVAFSRALIPDYNVLFGDEPTGNLDQKTSHEVMRILYNFVKKTKDDEEDATVIVSHDLKLAAKFADRIIVITKNDGRGIVRPEHIFTKVGNGEKIKDNYDFKTVIKRFFQKNEDAKQIMFDIRNTIWNINNDNSLLRQYIEKSGKPYNINRKYVTVTDYLFAIYIALRGEEAEDEIKNYFDPEFVNTLLKVHDKYVTKLRQKGDFLDDSFFKFLFGLLTKKTSVISKSDRFELDGHSSEEEKNKLQWKEEGSKAEPAFSNKTIAKHIDGLLDINLADELIKEEEDSGESHYKKSKRTFNKFIFNNFIALTKIIPDRSELSSEFTSLFYKKESGVLLGLGQRLKNFWIVFALMLVTFLAIGFANGSLKYLGAKMQDPFVNFINVRVRHDQQKEVNNIIAELNNDLDAINTYHINRATGFTIFSLDFVNSEDEVLSLVAGRTIDYNDPILPELLKESNFTSGEYKGFRSKTDCGIIVSEKLVRKLGYDPENTKYLRIYIKDGTKDTAFVPVPVRTIIKRIPEDTDDEILLLITDYLHKNLIKPIDPNNKPFFPSNTNTLKFFIDTKDSAIAEKVLQETKTYLRSNKNRLKGPNGIYMTQSRLIDYHVDTNYCSPGYKITVDFIGPKPDHITIKNFYDDMVESTNLSDYPVFMLYTQNLYPYPQTEKTDKRLDRITFHFAELDRIEAFEDEYIRPRSKHLRFNMAKVESLKNYNYISKLTRILSLILIILSVYSIASFLSNVFENHLNKIKMNIGTLMAFGTGGLKNIYRKLMWIYLIITLIFSFLIAILLGYAGVIRLVMSIWIKDVDTDLVTNNWFDWYLNFERFFHIFNWYTLAAIFLIFIYTSWKYSFIIKKILSAAPGNLITGRE